MFGFSSYRSYDLLISGSLDIPNQNNLLFNTPFEV